MVYVLSEISPPNCTQESLYVNVNGRLCLVVNKLSRLEFSIVSQNQLYAFDTLYVEDHILAMNSFSHPNLDSECLLLLTESNQLLFLWYDVLVLRFSVLHTIEFEAANQQLPADIMPKIEVDPSESPGFFVVYLFEGFLLVFIINKAWNPLASKRSKRKLNLQELVESFCMSVGAIVVQDIKFVRNSRNPALAILYRDYNNNYSLRTYSLSVDSKGLRLLKQYEEFENAPSTLINPTVGGILVVSDDYMFYFPNDEIKHLELDDSNNDPNLSCNSAGLVVTKKLDNLEQSEISAFEHFTIVDEKRILLINNRGDTYILFFDTTKNSGTSVLVNSFSFVKLGLTTVPTSVHHINENLFYVSSKLSQSVFFKVLPTEPFLDVCHIIPSSPPILDLQVIRRVPLMDLVCCQGGYDCGELRVVSNKTKYLEFVTRFQSTIKFPSIELFSKDNKETVLILKDSDSQMQLFSVGPTNSVKIFETRKSNTMSSKKDSKLLVVTPESISIDESVIRNMSVLMAKSLSSSRFMVLDSSNTVHVFSDLYTVEIKLLSAAEVSSFDMVNVFQQEYLVLVCFWNGSYELYLVSDGEQELVVNETIFQNDEPIVSCCSLYDSQVIQGCVWLLFVTSNNDLVQKLVNFKKNVVIHDRTVLTHLEGPPFKFAKNKIQNVLLYNKNQIFGLYLGNETKYHKMFSLNIVNLPVEINHIAFIDFKHLAVSANTDDIFIYEIKDLDVTKNVLYSNSFNTKSLILPDIRNALLLSSENKYIDGLNTYLPCSKLLLVNIETMSVRHKFEFPEADKIQITDICLLDTTCSTLIDLPKASYILAVCDSSENDKLLMIFQVKKGVIDLLPPVRIAGILDAEKVKPQNIQRLHLTPDKYLITGAVNFIIHPYSLHEWHVIPQSLYKSPIYTVSASNVDQTLVLADIMKGLSSVNLANIDADSLEIKNPKTYNETTLMTSVSVFNSQDGPIIFAADSFGNLLGLTEKDEDPNDEEPSHPYEEVILYNIGDPINTIAAIPPTVQNHSFHSIFDNHESTEELISPKVVLGTANGAIHMVSELLDIDNEMEYIISECYEELVSFKHTLSDVQYSNRREKISRWMRKRDFKLLQKDPSGKSVTKTATGIVDFILFQHWLFRDAMLSSYDQRGDAAYEELNSMKESLKKCYRNKELLQKLLHNLESV